MVHPSQKSVNIMGMLGFIMVACRGVCFMEQFLFEDNLVMILMFWCGVTFARSSFQAWKHISKTGVD